MSDFIEKYFFVFYFGALLWLASVVAVSVVFRRQRNKSIFPRLPASARFSQRVASGWSEDTWLRSLGGANNCLMVAVTEKELIVTPFFPFTLMFLPEIWGLELQTPLSQIRHVETAQRLFMSGLRIEFASGRKMVLVVRDIEKLRAALSAR